MNTVLKVLLVLLGIVVVFDLIIFIPWFVESFNEDEKELKQIKENG